MRPSTFAPLRQHAVRPLLSCPIRRYLSCSKLERTIRAELDKHPQYPTPNVLYRFPSMALTRILATYLPPACQAPKPHPKKQRHIPQGHHQLFFNPVLSEDLLLPDGTDTSHYPGPPFDNRLWAGGSLTFNPDEKRQLKYDNYGYLKEEIENVRVVGLEEGNEKAFITISRKIAGFETPLKRTKSFLKNNDAKKDELGGLAIEEKKILLFQRPKSQEEIRDSLTRVRKIVKPIHKPDFSITITPTAHLLSRFSALTSNAHRIHLDRQYCREVEGHRNLLVHGPLTQVLMLSVLRSQLGSGTGQMVLQFDYKNLAPLYADEEMRICVRKKTGLPDKFDVWIEGPEGGYAVKATAKVGSVITDDTPDTKPFEITKSFDKKPLAGEPTVRPRRISSLVKDLRLLKSRKNNSLEEARSEVESRQKSSEDALSKARRRVVLDAIRDRKQGRRIHRLARRREIRAASRKRRRTDELKIRTQITYPIGGQDKLGGAMPAGFKARRHARRVEAVRKRAAKRLKLDPVPETPPKDEKEKLLDLISVIEKEPGVKKRPVESNRWIWIPPPDEEKD